MLPEEPLELLLAEAEWSRQAPVYQEAGTSAGILRRLVDDLYDLPLSCEYLAVEVPLGKVVTEGHSAVPVHTWVIEGAERI